MIRAQNDPGRQVVKLGAYAVFASRWLIPRLPRFYDRHPDIDLEIVTIAAPLELPPHRCDAVVPVTHRRPLPGFHILPQAPISRGPGRAPRAPGPNPRARQTN